MLTSPLLILAAGVLASVAGMMLVRRFVPAEKLIANNEYVSFTYTILSLIYGIYLAFTVVVVWQQYEEADETVTREVVLLNALWRDVEPLSHEDRNRIHQDIIDYVNDVIVSDYPKMEFGLQSTSNDKYDQIWTDYFRIAPNANDLREVTFYQQGVLRLNEFSIARRMRILASNAALPTSMWVLLIVGATGTIMFTWFYGTRNLSIQIAATAFLSAVIIYGVLLVSMLEYPFGGVVRVGELPYRDLLNIFQARIKIELAQK
ncbi:MAG TPA: DUF4239 domain-containing protein [Thermoanaerobaculia bacterium]|jgi:hypothetical protein|nr:DUF4239 domain-containing protein [Thermoanaerobaculia bacterium]